jgi:hypothetical protein
MEARIDLSPAAVDVDLLAEALAAAFDTEGLRRIREVEVVLHAPLAQVRTLTDLPPVGVKDLHDLIKHRESSFFRPTNGECVLAAEWVTEGDASVARAALVEVSLLERLEDCLSACGLRVGRFLPTNGPSVVGPPLLTPRAYARRSRHRFLGALSAVLLAATGWLAAGAAYAWDLYDDDRSIVTALRALDDPLKRLDALNERLRAFAPIATAVRRQSEESSWLSEHLADIAEMLPDDTHLHRLATGRGAATRLEAHGPDAVSVVEQMEDWWPGHLRLEAAPEPEPLESGQRMERFAIILEQVEQ